MKHLDQTLSEVLGHYRHLCELLEANRLAVIAGETDDVERLSKHMETLLLKIRLLEDALDASIAEYARQHDVEQSLRAIARHMNLPDRDFDRLIDDLERTAQDADRLSRINRHLLNSALRINNHFLTLIDAELQHSRRYSATGKVQGKQQPVLLSRKA